MRHIRGKKGRRATLKLDLHASTCLSLVLYNIYTKGHTNLSSNSLTQVLTLADDGLICETTHDTHVAVTAGQEHLGESVSMCQGTGSVISPSQTQAQCSTLSNVATGHKMPVVFFNGKLTEPVNILRCPEIQFDGMFTYKTQVESTKLFCRKGLSGLKVKFARGIEPCRVFVQRQSVILSVIAHDLSLTSFGQPSLLKGLPTWCITKALESVWEQHPLRPCDTCWTCHQWKLDGELSKSRHTTVQCRVPRIHYTKLSNKKKEV